jgi:hypothetical protein
MSVKNKILAALDYALEDISEDHLIDILLDAYKAKKDHIRKLEAENEHERNDIYHERQRMREEAKCMRSDPLYCREGVYYFLSNGRKFTVMVQGGRVNLSELHRENPNIDINACPLSLEEWLRL